MSGNLLAVRAGDTLQERLNTRLSFGSTPEDVLDKIVELETLLAGHEPIEVLTDHVIHAGMYARTVTVPEGYVFTSVLMKKATLVIVAGAAQVLDGDVWWAIRGYNVIPASAGRKQVFVTLSEVAITMVFPTGAQTAAEAEAEFTDQADTLLSRRQNANRIVVTGE